MLGITSKPIKMKGISGISLKKTFVAIGLTAIQ